MKSVHKSQGLFDAPGLNIVLALSLLASLAAPARAGQTSTYVFLTDQSTVVKTGGFAGVNKTYPIQGQFRLEVDVNGAVASFVSVDAFLLSPISSSPPQSLGEVFDMTNLAGVIVDATTIRFEGTAADGSSVLITLTFSSGHTVTLKGGTTPPPNSADFFVFTLDAQAARTDQTSTYVFDPDQSTVIQTGGIAGIHRTYTITGTFVLTLDSETGETSFDRVDANAVYLSPPSRTGRTEYNLDPNDVFNMTGLAGTIADDGATIRFEGTAHDESSVWIRLTFSDGTVALEGGTTPPPNSADFFIYTLDAVAQAKYEHGAGSGTADDPYQIATAADLIALGKTPEVYDKHFILTEDIDLDPSLPGRKVFNRAIIAPDTLDRNRDFQGTSFTGVFDGQDHTVSHLAVQGKDYLGLFGQTGLEAEIFNLGIEDVNIITGSGSDIGGLVGANLGAVTNCYSTGTVSGNVSVGGLVAYNTGTIANSYSTANVKGGIAYVGGLVGRNGYRQVPDVGPIFSIPGSISNCYSAGQVVAVLPAGGLVGTNIVGGIQNCFWDVEVSGQAMSDGGIGKTTAEMQMASTFLDAGWDFVGETANGTEDFWSICEGTNYPRLTWQIPAGDVVCPDGITIDDFVFFIEHWLNNNCDSGNDWCDGADLDRSGVVDADDLEILLNNWPAEGE